MSVKVVVKVTVVAVAMLVSYFAASSFEEESSERADSVLYLGKPACSGVEPRGEDELKCGVELDLRGSVLPALDRDAASRIASVELTRVSAVGLSRCPSDIQSTAAPAGGPSLLDSGASPCRVYEGSERGLSLRNASDGALGMIALDELLQPSSPARDPARIWLLSAAANAIAVLGQAHTPLTTTVVVRPDQVAALSVSPGASLSLPVDASQRIVTVSPAEGSVRVNLGWGLAPTLLWRNVRLSKLSGPVAAKSSFDWLGQEYAVSHGNVQVEGDDLEATVALACEGDCFAVSFRATKATLSGDGATIGGRSAASRRKFQAFAAVCAFLLSLAAVFL